MHSRKNKNNAQIADSKGLRVMKEVQRTTNHQLICIASNASIAFRYPKSTVVSANHTITMMATKKRPWSTSVNPSRYSLRVQFVGGAPFHLMVHGSLTDATEMKLKNVQNCGGGGDVCSSRWQTMWTKASKYKSNPMFRSASPPRRRQPKNVK
jgi:hypothetical protein